MFNFSIINRALEDGKISDKAFRLLYIIVNKCSLENTDSVEIHNAHFMMMLNTSERWVRKLTNELVVNGYITKQINGNSKNKLPNTYTIINQLSEDNTKVMHICDTQKFPLKNNNINNNIYHDTEVLKKEIELNLYHDTENKYIELRNYKIDHDRETINKKSPIEETEYQETEKENKNDNPIENMKNHRITIPVTVSGKKTKIDLFLSDDEITEITGIRKFELWIETNNKIFEILPERIVDGYPTKDATKDYISRFQFETKLLPKAVKEYKFKSYEQENIAPAPDNCEKRSVIASKDTDDTDYQENEEKAQEKPIEGKSEVIENNNDIKNNEDMNLDEYLEAQAQKQKERTSKAEYFGKLNREYDDVFTATNELIKEWYKSHKEETLQEIRNNCVALRRMFKDGKITENQMGVVQSAIIDRMVKLVNGWKKFQEGYNKKKNETVESVKNTIATTKEGAQPSRNILESIVKRLNQTDIKKSEKIELVESYFSKVNHNSKDYLEFLKADTISQLN